MGTLSGIRGFLHSFTEPLEAPFRKLQQKLMPNMMLDFSPVIAIVLLGVIQGFVLSLF